MSNIKKKIGNWGEENAARFLINRGYAIVQKNYHSRYGEIDIICTKDDELIFVEVKTRRQGGLGSGEESVDYKKRQKIRLTIEDYLQKHETKGFPQFDVIVIELNGVKQKINHYRSVEI
ncbi:YraN family protein [Candidatus Falkowbacteria bacterium CG10_big_fil_rev_8_21_14_0_10_39_11]|uniref:UPF0102 protein COT97_00135 n=1 Tax=Candidatus Falkowbacteria bacterium CG10_big_fil_rev_8_21_14_0_10_39_11 TaxID=1974565 RepID=A0A2H0V6C6_9BACT|nr:MAG: YraN family protein [Candidatus Falkowbacteria bacterium CG10_big_fil_rev_8_21_14_0_10_39_11]